MCLLRLFLVVTVAAVTLGCGPACNSSSVCSVTGAPGADEQVCDGSGFVSCPDDNRGAVINCQNRNQRAVCSPNGWAFEPTGGPSDGGT
jgi:hypothetical protein